MGDLVDVDEEYLEGLEAEVEALQELLANVQAEAAEALLEADEAVAVEKARCLRIANYHKQQHGDVASNLPRNLARAEEEALERLATEIEKDIERGWAPGESS